MRMKTLLLQGNQGQVNGAGGSCECRVVMVRADVLTVRTEPGGALACCARPDPSASATGSSSRVTQWTPPYGVHTVSTCQSIAEKENQHVR